LDQAHLSLEVNKWDFGCSWTPFPGWKTSEAFTTLLSPFFNAYAHEYHVTSTKRLKVMGSNNVFQDGLDMLTSFPLAELLLRLYGVMFRHNYEEEEVCMSFIIQEKKVLICIFGGAF
jgi:hypothetical protein